MMEVSNMSAAAAKVFMEVIAATLMLTTTLFKSLLLVSI